MPVLVAVVVLSVLAFALSVALSVVGMAVGLALGLIGLVLKMLPVALVVLAVAFFLGGGRVERGDDGSVTIRFRRRDR